MSSSKVTDTFYEITGINLSPASFLNMFNIMEDDDKIKFINIFRSYIIDDDILKDVLYYDTYDVESDDWWELVSYVLYESVNLWWVNSLMNGINNPFEELNTGSSIKLLKETYVPQLLREIRSISEL